MTSLTVSIVQPDLKWEDKDANLQMLKEKIMSLPDTELVVLPEMFSTGFSMRRETLAETMEGESVQWMKNIASRKKIILTGSLIIKEDDAYYNRLIWMLPNGQYGHYDKRHLFGYAGEHEHYTAGNKRLIASVKGWKINLLICYDLRFPVWSRQGKYPSAPEESITPEYDVLVYVANWPERRAHAWKTLLQARAIENQCYVVGVNRVGHDGNNINHSGDSMIIDPLGEPLVKMNDEAGIHTRTLEKGKLEDTRGRLPFLKDGDKFIIM
jgi:predicted amidohydrolase